jgi:SagB-type dehydrogenase family enzyme
LFHARSREGRHANITGGTYPHIGMIDPLPAVRKPWPGEPLRLPAPRRSKACPDLPLSEVMARRRSTREFDHSRPITLAELSEFLHRAARVKSVTTVSIDAGGRPCGVELSSRPYPSGGASYELELYLAANHCRGLPAGFYHYDAGAHALVRISCNDRLLQQVLVRAQHAMGIDASPQIMVTIAARFGRVSWKYRSLAYAVILKDVGVLVQTFYLVAAQMNLGACAIGSGDIELFAKMTGLDFNAEGSVGEFVLGRPK